MSTKRLSRLTVFRGQYVSTWSLFCGKLNSWLSPVYVRYMYYYRREGNLNTRHAAMLEDHVDKKGIKRTKGQGGL